MVKGAYQEPADKAFPKKADVNANYDLLTKITMDAALAVDSPKISDDELLPPIPAVATHDEKRIEFAKQYAAKIGLPKEALEIQMLYGIRRDLQDQLVKEVIPFGYTFRLEHIGIHISCGVWRNARQIFGFSFPISLKDKWDFIEWRPVLMAERHLFILW